MTVEDEKNENYMGRASATGIVVNGGVSSECEAGTNNRKESVVLGTGGGTFLSKKIRKLADSHLETDGETREALKELSEFFGENSLKNRRNLRGQIERRSLGINADFLSGFEAVKRALDDVWEEAVLMKEACGRMQNVLSQTKSKTQHLLVQSSQMQQQNQDLARRELLLKSFICRYQLTSLEEGELQLSPDYPQPIGPAFFAALERCQKIQDECRSVIKRGRQSSTASEIADQMSRLQDSGLQRLYRWTRSVISGGNVGATLGEDGSREAVLPTAMKHLSIMRPSLFAKALEEYNSVRRSHLVRAFLDALTVGGPHGIPKPIEFHAHDPLRYVGDMMAWLHQATPAESENLKLLLKQVIEVRGVEMSEAEEKPNIKDKVEIADDSLCNISEGLCRPLRSRVEQILISETNPVVLYKLCNLIRFYVFTLEESVLPPKSGLTSTLKDFDRMSYKQFVAVLQTTVQRQTDLIRDSSSDLSPPSTLALLSLLKEILSSTSSIVEERQEELKEIVNTIVDPLLASVTQVTAAFSSTDRDVFLLNCFYQVHLTLSLFKFNDFRLSQLESEMQLHLDTLSSEQTSNLIANLGIQPVSTLLCSNRVQSIRRASGGDSTHSPLSKVDGMDANSLRHFTSKLDGFLVAPDMYMLPQIRLLSSSSHRKIVSKRSLQVVSASYKQLYEAVVDPVNLYDKPTINIVPKTPEQVELLLQL